MPRTWVPVVPVPAELREGTAGQVPRLGEGRAEWQCAGMQGRSGAQEVVLGKERPQMGGAEGGSVVFGLERMK